MYLLLLQIEQYQTASIAFGIFIVVSFSILMFKWAMSTRYKNESGSFSDYPVTVIIPVVDEPDDMWRMVLDRVKMATVGLTSEVIVVCNGAFSEENYRRSTEYGFKTLKIERPSKRNAIAEAVKIAEYNGITIILDSDTLMSRNTVVDALRSFNDKSVGGVTPEHRIYDSNRSIMRRVSAWMEDERFFVTLRGTNGAISCLPGRLLAIRTPLLREYMPGFLNQTFLGQKCETGDDRYISQRILLSGYRTMYDDLSYVYTSAPDTLSGFIKQRLRWSRSSMRESILSSKYMWEYPYTFFVIVTNILIRWAFFGVIILALVRGGTLHGYVLGYAIIGFFIGHALRQLPHLMRYPRDIVILPIYALVSTFVLLPVELWGNVTLLSNKWMTRKTTV